jgi:hypothetical protein
MVQLASACAAGAQLQSHNDHVPLSAEKAGGEVFNSPCSECSTFV